MSVWMNNMAIVAMAVTDCCVAIIIKPHCMSQKQKHLTLTQMESIQLSFKYLQWTQLWQGTAK